MTLSQPATCNLPTCNLSVIIVNWNTRDLLADCLASVAGSRACPEPVEGLQVPGSDAQPSTFETFVVDNGSTDGSAGMVRERFPWVKLIENEQNAGFARANNQGIGQATGRYVLLLNPDTEVRPGARETLVGFMDTHPQAGAAGARLLNADGSLQPACHPMLTPGREFWRLLFLEKLWPRASYPLARWDTVTPRRVEVIKGACLLLRRDALDQAGVLDESYFMYTEEVDLCYRLGQAGWELWYVPTAAVTHFGEASSRQVKEAMYLQLYRSKIQFFRKFGGERRARLAKALLALAYAPRAAIASAAASVQPNRRPQAHIYRRLLAELPGM